MVLFRYIEDKDVFRAFYAIELSRRLVYDVSASDESEASMVSKLKEACGVQYTRKLERMFTGMFCASFLSSDDNVGTNRHKCEQRFD